MTYTSRERVLCALDHREPDRVPLFFGTSGVTTVLEPGYAPLRARLGLPPRPAPLFIRALRYAWPHEDVLQRLGSDARTVAPGPPPSTLARDISDDAFVDAWGLRWERAPGSLYFECRRPPLATATLADLERYPWPDLCAPARFTGLAERTQAIRDHGYAVVLMSGITLFETACLLRGHDNLLADLLADEEFFVALLQKVKGLQLAYAEVLLRHAGPYADILTTGDDLGTQDAPMMAPKDYRRLIKPQEAELLAALKRGTRAKIFFHSCGAIYPLLGDLAEIGVDIINPVQVSAGELGDTARLKREFGDRLSFNGGIDTRWVMPRGTPEDVRAEVRRRIRDLAPGGGYVASAVHCLQPDVPAENIVTMCDAVREFGRYPLDLRG